MTKCSYCGEESDEFKGINVVDSVSGKLRYFCSGKCRAHGERKAKRKKIVKKKEWALHGSQKKK